MLPVLEPDLNDPHVEPQRLRELFPNVAGGFGAVFVGLLELFQLARRDGGTRSFACHVSFCNKTLSSHFHLLPPTTTTHSSLLIPNYSLLIRNYSLLILHS